MRDRGLGLCSPEGEGRRVLGSVAPLETEGHQHLQKCWVWPMNLPLSHHVREKGKKERGGESQNQELFTQMYYPSP